MQAKRSKQLYHVVLRFQGGVTRTVSIKAVDRPTAEKRALKFNRGATGVKRDVA